MGSFRDRAITCLASYRQCSNYEPSPGILLIYLKIIATDGFSLQNVSLLSLEWHIKTLLRWRNGKFIFWGRKKGVVCRIFWCHYTFTKNQLVVIEDKIFVTKPIFCLFIIITPYQIHWGNINEKKIVTCSKFYLQFGVILTYLKDIFSDIKT